MQDDPTVFIKRIVTITLFLAVILAGVLYFSRSNNPADSASDTESGSRQGIYQSDIDKANAPASGSTSGTKRSLPSSPSLSASNDLIRKAENVPATVSVIVYYDQDGFHPANFAVKGGTSVRFINRSTLSMRVSSVIQNGAPIYTEFDQIYSVGRGGYYDFNFSKAGIWSFTNQSVPQHFGVVTVLK